MNKLLWAVVYLYATTVHADTEYFEINPTTFLTKTDEPCDVPFDEVKERYPYKGLIEDNEGMMEVCWSIPPHPDGMLDIVSIWVGYQTATEKRLDGTEYEKHESIFMNVHHDSFTKEKRIRGASTEI